MDHEPFFKRGPSPRVRLAFFGLLSISMLVSDAYFNHLNLLRQGVGLVLHPLQQIANSPLTLYRRAGDFFVTQHKLAGENEALREAALTHSQKLQTNAALEAENSHLRRLLNTRERHGVRAVAVEVMSAGRDPFSRKIVVDKGLDRQIESGQATIDDQGLVGQITHVQVLSSEVTLITDKGQAVPVEVLRNGLRAIAFGRGQDNTLELAFMPINMDIQLGDQLVTSGIDGVYPRGIPVAVVAQVERSGGLAFAKIVCKPNAGVDRYRHLLVVSVEPASEKPKETPKETHGKTKK
jgi:rod shape-determining protein MreC